MAPVCITLSQHLPFRGVFILKMGNTCLSTPLLRLTYWGFVVSDLRQNEMSDMTALNHYLIGYWLTMTLQWRHNGRNSVSNHQLYDCLLNRLFRRRSKKTSKHRVTGLCAGNSPGPVNSPHKWPVTRKMFPFDDVIMNKILLLCIIKVTFWKLQCIDPMNWNDTCTNTEVLKH